MDRYRKHLPTKGAKLSGTVDELLAQVRAQRRLPPPAERVRIRKRAKVSLRAMGAARRQPRDRARLGDGVYAARPSG